MIPPADPLDVTFEVAARARFEIVDLRTRFSSEHADAFASFPRCLYWSAHTTAGFLDLDGVNEGRPRRRQTRVIGFHREVVAAQTRLRVPLSGHPIDSINLKDPALGLSEELAEFVAKADVGKGRLHIALGHGERDAALTINEFETLLMKYDLAAA